MGFDLDDMEALELWRRTLLAGIHRSAPDLSVRQTAILLCVYLTPPPHTVRGLAARLKISKPAVTRALDTLSGLGVLRRKADENDRRSVLVHRTVAGSVYLSEFAETIVAAGTGLGSEKSPGSDPGAIL